MSKYPGHIQTEEGFIFNIVGYNKGRLIIGQGSFVDYYNIFTSEFYGVENGQAVKRELTPCCPESFKNWLKRH